MGPALLFCPADRPDRYLKAADRSDAVILDLEDAVDPAGRPAARESLRAQRLDPATTIVRVNPVGSADFEADLDAVSRTDYRTLMVPKVGGAAGLAELEGFELVALCETAAGVLAAADIAALPNVTGIMWGAEDLIASLGGTSSRGPDGGYRDVARHARSAVLLAAAATGVTAIDTVHLDIGDLADLAVEVEDAAASGFGAVACIHPSQVDVIRAAYRPGDEAMDWARAVLKASADEPGVFRFRGAMVDGPVLRHAAELLSRAGEGDSGVTGVSIP